GVARHADRAQIEPALQRRNIAIQRGHAVEHEVHVLGARDGIAGFGRRPGQVPRGLLALPPDRVVTPQMLEVDRDVAMARPMLAEVLVAVPRAAEAMGKDDDRERSLSLL